MTKDFLEGFYGWCVKALDSCITGVSAESFRPLKVVHLLLLLIWLFKTCSLLAKNINVTTQQLLDISKKYCFKTIRLALKQTKKRIETIITK